MDVRIFDDAWWSTAAREDHRLQQKIRIVLKKDLQVLAAYSEKAEKALINPPANWINWVLGADFITERYLGNFACCACNNIDCFAWIAFKCGGCKKTYWVEQRTVGLLWCWTCASQWMRFDSDRALQQFTGLPGNRGLQLFESIEQLILAFLRWEIKHQTKRFEIIRESEIVSVRCQRKVPLMQRSMVPVETDPEADLDLCIALLNLRIHLPFASRKIKPNVRKRGRKNAKRLFRNNNTDRDDRAGRGMGPSSTEN